MIGACFNGEKPVQTHGLGCVHFCGYKTANNLNIVKRYLQTKPGQIVKRTRTICPPTLYFHRTVYENLKHHTAEFQNFNIKKSLVGPSSWCAQEPYSPVKVKCRRTKCPRTICPAGHSLLQVRFRKS